MEIETVLPADSAYHWGAYPQDWQTLVGAGLEPDLLPIVSNQEAEIHPKSKLKSIGKAPSQYIGSMVWGFKEWSEHTATPEEIELWQSEPDYGIGVQCRTIRAIDIDISVPDMVAEIEAIVATILGLPLPKRIRKNSPKILLAFRCEGPFKKQVVKTEAGKVEFLGDGQQFVAAGTHPSGVRYEWENGLPAVFPVVPADKISAAIDAVRQKYGIEKKAPATKTVAVRDVVNTGDFSIDNAVAYLRRVECATDGDRNNTVFNAAATLKNLGVQMFAAFKLIAKHVTINPPLPQDEFLIAVESAYGNQGVVFGRDTPQYAFGDLAEPSIHERAASWKSRADVESAAWEIATLREANPPEYEQLEKAIAESTSVTPAELAQIIAAKSPAFARDKKTREIIANLRNIRLALQDANVCGAAFSYDTFRQERVIAWHGQAPGLFKEADAVELREHLESEARFQRVSPQMMSDSLIAHDRRCELDSAQVWLDSLKWDGTPRIEKFFSEYLKAEDSPYTRAVGLYVWTAHAGRIIKPGVQADMVPVLIGAQGARKGSMLMAIAPTVDQYCELDLNANDDDIARLLVGKLVAEICELKGLSTREAGAIKSWVTRRREQWIPKYREQATTYPRRALFWGTTNDEHFLSDGTGERRWLPVRVGKIDIDAIVRDRDQLWAEGAARFRGAGVLWEEAERLAQDYHEQHKSVDPWEEVLRQWASAQPEPFTTDKALRIGIGVSAPQLSRGYQMRAADCLKKLGYENPQKRVDGQPVRLWVKKTAA